MEVPLNYIPKDSCPKCGHRKFLVRELVGTTYLTDEFGKIVDSTDGLHLCRGICMNCAYQCDMYPTRQGFIPLTPLRKFLLEYSDEYLNKRNVFGDESYLPNPMVKK